MNNISCFSKNSETVYWGDALQVLEQCDPLITLGKKFANKIGWRRLEIDSPFNGEVLAPPRKNYKRKKAIPNFQPTMV